MGLGYSQSACQYVDLEQVKPEKEGETGILTSVLQEQGTNYADFFGVKTINELVELNAKNYGDKPFLGSRQLAEDGSVTGPYKWLSWGEVYAQGKAFGAFITAEKCCERLVETQLEDVAPILDLVETFAELKDELRWGYHLPYAITGYYNLHPRAAIERMAREDRYQVRGMYEAMAGRIPATQVPVALKTVS